MKDGKRIKEGLSAHGKDRKSSSSSHHRGHDVHRKMKEIKDRELKDFLSATDTIPNHHIKKDSTKPRSKEDSKYGSSDRDNSKKDKDRRDKQDASKRRLSSQHSIASDHHNDDGQPKSKIPKIKSEHHSSFDSANEPPDAKKLKTSNSLDAANANGSAKQELKMGRIPKIKQEKTDDKPSTVGSSGVSANKSLHHAGKEHHHTNDDHKKHKHHSRSRHDEKGRSSKGEDRHSSSKFHDARKSSKSKERDLHKLKMSKDESKKRPRLPHSSDEEMENKRKHSSSHSSSGIKTSSSRHGDKEHREEKDRRKSTSSSSSSHKPTRILPGNETGSEISGEDSDGEPKKFSIFDDPLIDLDNPVYFSMYDKVKARRSCVKDRVEQARRQQEELLAKFSKLKKKRAERGDGHHNRDGEDSDASDSLTDSESDEEINSHLVKSRKKSKTALLSSSSGDESDKNDANKTNKPKSNRVQFSDTDSDDSQRRNTMKSHDKKSPSKHGIKSETMTTIHKSSRKSDTSSDSDHSDSDVVLDGDKTVKSSHKKSSKNHQK
jgi:hypothetical protein